MGDKATLAKAKMELEELYLGVPNESVNLTFQDLAQVRQQNAEQKRPSPSPSPVVKKSPSPLAKLPSLDFNKAFEMEDSSRATHSNYYSHHDLHHHRRPQDSHKAMPMATTTITGGLRRPTCGRDHKAMPMATMTIVPMQTATMIILIITEVCGRVYCRQCVSMGMGDMPEGRKCIECLGRRFSQRYIQKAGNVGCCMGYSSTVKQQELKWAEKGPRRSGENRYNHSMMASRSRSPVAPATPSRPHSASMNPPSFVKNSPYLPYSPTSHHPLPF
ncbi:UNVERIFIED_CONTAM: hypothetical protein Slati_0516900 [Sesamum latifolium]|uniref:Uncharacterized protein n=1 Tax=Sesamum latifolium TaxID=2727402 RepID=A0AAW2Y038_9LAMI